MNLNMMRGMFRHGMRAYYVPAVSGLVLAACAFMPWTRMGDIGLGGVPSMAGWMVLGLGVLTVVLASLSIVTRRNSRHPLLLVGLAAFAVLLLGEKYLERSAADQLWPRAQAQAIVQGEAAQDVPVPVMGVGAIVGLAASSVITLFGLTIVVKRASAPYAEPEDDDV